MAESSDDVTATGTMDRPQGVEIPAQIRDAMVAHARDEAPNEACGFFAGTGHRVERFYRVRNEDQSPVTYRMDGKEQLEAQKDMDRRGLDVVGVFHSHPASQAYPSETDRRRAYWPEGSDQVIYPQAAYVICSLQHPGDPEIRGFRFRDGGPVEVEVQVSTPPTFTEEQVLRYSRHIILPQIGGAGQRKLLEARVLCIGAGGLGSPAALYLAAAGVGTLGILDFDRVDLTNLQRQILHDTDDVGRLKVDSAADRIADINPDVRVVKHHDLLTSDNAFDILAQYDVIVDGTDNFPVRYLVNDATQMLGKPLVYGSIYQFDGQASVFLPGPETPCYRCLFPHPPPPGAVPSCSEAGVFGVLPGIVGSVQAVEAIKLITGVGEPLAGRLLLVDALEMEFTTVKVRWDPNCPVCGTSPTVTELIDYEQFCGLPSSRPKAG